MKVKNVKQEVAVGLTPDDLDELCELATTNFEEFEKKLSLLIGKEGSIDRERYTSGVVTVLNCDKAEVRIEEWKGKNSEISFQDFPVGNWIMNATFENLGQDWNLKCISLKKQTEVQNGTVFRTYLANLDKYYLHRVKSEEKINELWSFCGQLLPEHQLFESYFILEP